MASAETLYRFELELSDIDRGIYTRLNLRVACHPSEGPERLAIRVLARALAHEPRLEFGRGLSSADEPALWTRSDTGEIQTWIDVGCPSADRLHRASKAAERTLVVTDRPDDVLRKEWSSRKIFGAERIEVLRVSPDLAAKLVEDLPRNPRWYVTVQDATLSVADGEHSFDSELQRETLAAILARRSG